MSQLISITSLSSDVTFASGRREDREEEEGDLHGKMASPTFETLLAMNVPHILEAIFFSLDYKSFKRCMDVCVAWNVLLKSKAFKTKAKCNFTHDIRRDQEKLQYAASDGNINKVKKLVTSGLVDLYHCGGGTWGLTPLCAASQKSHKSVVKWLLEEGADVDHPDSAGNTPLLHTALHGDTDVGQLLLNAGAQPNKINEEGRTPLHVAASRGHLEVVKMLLRWGADYDLDDNEGLSPLHLAAGSDRKHVVQLLLCKGANPNKSDEQGRTPLHWAAFCGLQIVVQLLLDSLADPDMLDAKGFTPVQLALSHGFHLDEFSTDSKIDPHLASDKKDDRSETSSTISCLNPYPTATSNSKKKKRKKNKGRVKVQDEATHQNPNMIPPSQNETDTDPTKRLRKLRKKLRDTEALEAKLQSGEIKNPDPEQLEKVSRKSEVENKISALERLISDLSVGSGKP